MQVAEEAIRLLLSAVQQSKDSIIITTAHLNPPGPEIVYVNPAFTEMTGYTADEVLGKTPRLLQGPDTDRSLLDDLRQHLIDGEPFHGEAINYHKDGTKFYVEWNITPIRNIEGAVTHFVAIQRNITERKRLEDEREHLLNQEQAARTEAEAANRTKDEFLATLSHELRTPLTPILGWSKILQTKKLPETKLREALETIEQHAKRQAQLVDDLLDLSRIVQGKLTLDLTAVALIKAIAAALETVWLSAEARSIQLHTQLDATVPPIMGDGGRLQQVFWNLLSNAIKFTPDGGQITVTLERVGRSAQVTIRDTGHGISPDFLPFVFDRFRQADSSITRGFGGLGLGLSLSRQLVEAHGGMIRADSAGIGKGSTFTVQFPLSDTALTSAPEQGASLSSIEDVRVLLVEDDRSTLQFTTYVLEQAGAIVTAVTSAKAALKALANDPFDILVSDIGLHEIDGYKLLHQLRSRSKSLNQTIPAIALTAYATQSDRQQALAAGYQQHLAKPFEPDALVAAIAATLERQA
nr:ATP-binding protein [Leptolyngbya sp. FACHB-36]